MESKFISYRNKFIADAIFEDITDSMNGYREMNGNRILDLGCGDGMLLRNLEEMIPSNCFTYKGIDIELTEEQKMVGGIGGVGGGIFEEIDIEKYLLTEVTEKYDYIVLQEVLEHLDRDKTIPVLFRLIRRMSSGGKVILSVPNYKRLTNSLGGSLGRCGGGKKFMDDTHKFEFVDGELDNLLRVLDYEVIDKKYIILYLGEWVEKYVGGLVPWKVRDVVLGIKPKWASHFVYVCKKKECVKEEGKIGGI